MSLKRLGGGGAKCAICTKTVYPAETIQFEKVPYHVNCFRCKTCTKKMEGPAHAAKFGEDIHCHKCFKNGGFAQKQRSTKWVPKTNTASAGATPSRFGGGGMKCKVCDKTVYAAEAIQFEKQPYHAPCFKCSTCGKKMLGAAKAAIFEDSLYCHKCFADGGFARKQANTKGKGTTEGGDEKKANPLASKFGGGGAKCIRCAKTVYSAETVNFEKSVYHQKCFTCIVESCGVKLDGKAESYKHTNEQGETVIDAYCKKCFHLNNLHQAKVNP